MGKGGIMEQSKLKANECSDCVLWLKDGKCNISGNITTENYYCRFFLYDKHKKMWKEIMLKCMVMSDPAFQEVIKWMRELEKENNG